MGASQQRAGAMQPRSPGPGRPRTLDGVLDGHALLGHLCVHLERLGVGAEQLHLRQRAQGMEQGARGSPSGRVGPRPLPR